ncbi:iron-containing alcohol dehydrogenase [Alteribacillus sp. JSM 102045]|uniref:iron-containing alcohol dehydrogenase n=1 Tax=Alteribacillus sp. JSM 102045 TaxID=1562101 RepID=UPI0035BF6226
MITKFVAPEIIFGEEAIQQTGESFLRLGAQRVLVVSDHGVAEAGWAEKAMNSLKDASLTYVSYFEATTNPQIKEVEKGAQIYQENECDAVLGVGGGSALDVAKSIAILVSNGGNIEDYEGIDKIKKPLPPTIMISTTSGSGSEVSQFAIILDPVKKKKMTIVSKSLVPDIAIIDPFTLMTKDSLLTAATGLDVLTHAIEAYVSVAATPLTDVQAIQSMELVEQYLRPSVASKTNLEAKKAMAMSSLQAGLAFSNAILGAVHAMSHAIGGQYKLSHGEINSILLPHVMEFNFIASPERFCHIGSIFCKLNVTEKRLDLGRAAITAIRNLADDIGAPKTLREAGLKKPDYSLMADIALNDACMVTNPRDITKKDIEQLLQDAY